jgi:hypothetical protein
MLKHTICNLDVLKGAQIVHMAQLTNYCNLVDYTRDNDAILLVAMDAAYNVERYVLSIVKHETSYTPTYIDSVIVDNVDVLLQRAYGYMFPSVVNGIIRNITGYVTSDKAVVTIKSDDTYIDIVWYGYDMLNASLVKIEER